MRLTVTCIILHILIMCSWTISFDKIHFKKIIVLYLYRIAQSANNKNSHWGPEKFLQTATTLIFRSTTYTH